jgi:hypothetical protein
VAKYGRPEESRREQRTLALELPRDIADTTDPAGDRPPIEVYDVTDLEDPDLSGMAPITPIDVDLEGPIAEFHFSPALEPGEYQVVVRQSRLTAEDREPYELLEDGFPWTGWTFQVLNASDRHEPDVAGEKETRTRTRPSTEVYIDGDTAGSHGLSGETITVIPGEETDEVELLIKPLLSGQKAPLYADYVSKTPHTVDGKQAFTFSAAAPIEDYRWGVYHGVNTVGQVPQTSGSKVVGVPVMREPVAAEYDPLVTYTRKSVERAPNTYATVEYDVTPQNKSVEVSKLEQDLIIGPEKIEDSYDTPDTNPRLFDHGIYRDKPAPEPTDEVAVLDLPLHCQLAVEVDGRRVWGGQTRLLPVFVSLERAEAELGWVLDNPQAESEALRRIWRASIEASRLWGCGMPPGPRPPGTVREFVLTRLANPIDRTSGTQGETRSQIGGQRTSAKSDRAGERRLSALAALLKDCESSVPMRPEEHIPAMSVGYADAANTQYPEAGGNPADIIAPLYDSRRKGLDQHFYTSQYISEYQRMGLPRS